MYNISSLVIADRDMFYFNRLKIYRPKLKLLLISLLLFWIPLIVLGGIANEVSEPQPLYGGTAVLNYIHGNFSPKLSDIFLIATILGNAISIVIVTGLIIGGLVYCKIFLQALILLFSVSSAELANLIIKQPFKRDRLTLWSTIIHEQSFSFPSGHAMASSALAFSLIYITWRTRFKRISVIFGGAFILAVGISRLYFGVHYPSDVIAGWLASLIWVGIVVTALTSSKFSSYFRKFVDKPKS